MAYHCRTWHLSLVTQQYCKAWCSTVTLTLSDHAEFTGFANRLNEANISVRTKMNCRQKIKTQNHDLQLWPWPWVVMVWFWVLHKWGKYLCKIKWKSIATEGFRRYVSDKKFKAQIQDLFNCGLDLESAKVESYRFYTLSRCEANNPERNNKLYCLFPLFDFCHAEFNYYNF